MIELPEVIRIHGPEYLEKLGYRMSFNHKLALVAIAACRTDAMGGHLEECDQHCGHFDYVSHSCKNASCLKCHDADTKRWLLKREVELLPVPYFHMVFTLPAELRDIVRRNLHALYGILFEAATASLIKLGLDRKYLGGRLGMVTVLHIWTRAKEYHPHLHLLVPGGALDKKGYDGRRGKIPSTGKGALADLPGHLHKAGKEGSPFRNLLSSGMGQGLGRLLPADLQENEKVAYQPIPLRLPGCHRK